MPVRPFELFVALRYLRSRSRSHFVSFISLISVIGIALAVAVLIVVLSVMNGFEFEVRNRILSVVSHATITGMDGRLEDWSFLQDLAESNETVLATAPFVRGQGMLRGAAGIAGIELRGILPRDETETSGAASLIREGSLDALESGSYRIVIGTELATRLGAGIGDKVDLMTTLGTMTPAGMMPRTRRFEVVGIFYAGMYEYDRSLAYVHLADAARLLRLNTAITGINLAVSDPLAAADIVRTIARGYGGGVYVSDWTRQHANFFRSIELTKSIIFVILLMIVAVAAFNIVSTLVMVVREKAAEIAIMRSMGASAQSVLKVFMFQGTLIGAIGTVTGVVIGLAVAYNLGTIVIWIENLLQIQFVAPDVYFISELPSKVEYQDVTRIGTVAFILAVAATIYPALRGAVTNPAQALRHE
ncbi:MAG: lipoprotein-releasing system transmembrane subunit LolC [Chromatiales bacterium]|jgi:lipoprotein-releasing system permease protein|nr:lipoprotein-releasing system transmembrane subunit LolC [Chromatiales bacterium]MDP6151561.1 lipoprotein-releasing ABC transporter permease subunit [Gammaproteobacteria bacterium]